MEAPYSLAGEACLLVQEVAAGDILLPTSEQHYERRVGEQSMTLEMMIGVRVIVHSQTSDVSYPATDSGDPYHRLALEVGLEVVGDMEADNVFVDGMAQYADCPS